MTSTAAPHPYAPLLALAFDNVEAHRAGEAIAFHREPREAEGWVTRSYEVVVPSPPLPLRAFLDTVCPKLASHLESLRQSPDGVPGVFVSLFVLDRLYFIGSVEMLRFHLDLRRQDPPVALLPGRRF